MSFASYSLIGQQSGSVIFTPSQQVFINTDKNLTILPEAEQFQLSQLLLVCQVLQSPHHLHGPLLDLHQYVCVCLVALVYVRAPACLSSAQISAALVQYLFGFTHLVRLF